MADVISIEAQLKNLVSPGIKDIADSLKGVETSAKSAGEKSAESLGKVKRSAEESGNSVKGMLGNILSIAGGVGVVNVAGDAFDFLKESVSKAMDAAKEHQATQASLAASLKATSAATGVTSEMANKLADSLSGVTTFSSNTILSGESMLATFDKIGKNTFPQATNMALDLAAKLGLSVPNAARLLGRALEDPAKGLTQLTRYGITLSAAQKDQIKHFMAVNDVADAQKVVLGALHSRFGDVAQAIGDTFTGKLQILHNKFELMQENIGSAVIPILTNLLGAVMPLVSWFTDNLPKAVDATSSIFKNVLGPAFKGIMDAIGPLVQAIGEKLAPVVKTIGEKFQDFAGFLKSTNPVASALKSVLEGVGVALAIFATSLGIAAVGAVVTAIPVVAGLAGTVWGLAAGVIAATWPIDLIAIAVVAIVALFKHWWDTNEGFRQALENLAKGAMTLLNNALSAVKPIIQDVIKYFVDLAQAIGEKFAPVISAITKLIQDNMPLIKTIISDALNVIKGIWTAAWSIISNDLAVVWDAIKLVLGTAFNTIKLIFSVFLDAIKGNWSGVWTDIKNFLANEWDLIKNVVGDALGHVKDIIATVWNAITTLTHNIWTNIQTGISDAWTHIKTGVQTDINNVKTTLGTAWSNISSGVSNAWSNISSTIDNTVHNIWTGIQNMAGNIKNAILSPFESARDAIGGIMKSFANFGLSILNGDLRSITAFVNGFGGAIDFVAGKLGHPNLIPHIQAPQVAYLAKGTDSFDGGMAIVGEEGPELVTLPKGSKVMPANQTKATLAALHGSIPAFSGGIGDVLGDIVGWFTKGAGALVSTALSAAHINASLPGDLTALGSGALNILKNFAVSDIQGFLSAMQSSVTGNGVGGTAAGLLRGFPQFNQLALSDRNKDFDCVPTSLAAGATYLLGHLLSPVQLKDAVYGAGYTGGTSPGRFGSYLRAHGVGLGSIGGNGTSIVEAAIGNIKRGIPTAVSIPSAWNNAASQAPTHEVIFAGFDQRTNTLTAMNPWGGFWQSQNASWWMPRIRYGVGNPMTRLATGGLIPEPVMGIGLHSGNQYSLGERGPEYVTPGSNFAAQPVIHNHTHVYIDGREIGDTAAKHIVQRVRTVTQMKV